ncbi:MAG: hypothetical protein JRJ09_03835 [Deltaproteobacteria bacterium]|nr:hypothetical protein [Deltaproteobacteria bacterium]MBW2047643.1 hypothetical protein [Deltaproteobacteria bacterium]MBW2351763.1 hypothetical protein [Deltaproteobacteria bacterium]
MKMIGKTLGKIVMLIFLSVCFLLPSCTKSPLTGWQYRPYEGGPPSWENDFGRPDGNIGGEDPWS